MAGEDNPIMSPRAPNYSQERIQRERAQRLKNQEKAERRAEKTAKRKATKDEQGNGQGANTSPDKSGT
jgi:hypothetical protein